MKNADAGRGECLRSQKLWPKETINAGSVAEYVSVREIEREKKRTGKISHARDREGFQIDHVHLLGCVCVCAFVILCMCGKRMQ